MNQLEKTLTSLEVAEMVGREHNEVLKDIRRIIGQLGVGNLPQSFFVESKYVNSQKRTMPMFRVTKKGCELYSTRMTGEKGTQFAVAYIERFNEMENHIKKESTPQVSQAELIAMIAQQGVEQEQRLLAVEKKQDNIGEIITLNTQEWRRKANKIINAIAKKRGGFESYSDVRNESYELLEERAKCRLSIRLTNRKSEMALNGVSPSKIKKVNNLDVIEDDARLTEIYLAIIKEMAIKYGVEPSWTHKSTLNDVKGT